MSLIETINKTKDQIEKNQAITANDKLKKRMLLRLNRLEDLILSIRLSGLTRQKLELSINRLGRLSDRITDKDIPEDKTTSTAIKDFFKCLEFAILLCENSNETGYNTDKFYKEEIEELEKQITKYQQEINKNKNLEIQTEYENNKQLIEKYKFEIEQNKKRDDAINNWKNKISEAFKGLEGPLNRLVDEHKRLEWLYNVYKWSSAALVFFLIIIEVCVYIKIVCSDAYPTWEQYLPMALPVPITLGLLWGFITQMNRAQRQMVVLSNKIHEIKYTEGLLQALNTLSVDIGESMSKINDAISQLIDNHLRNMDNMRLDEKDLSKIEKQNALPIEQIPELIKLINKSKE